MIANSGSVSPLISKSTAVLPSTAMQVDLDLAINFFFFFWTQLLHDINKKSSVISQLQKKKSVLYLQSYIMLDRVLKL